VDITGPIRSIDMDSLDGDVLTDFVLAEHGSVDMAKVFEEVMLYTPTPVPTPFDTPTPNETATPTPLPIPATDSSGMVFLGIVITLLILLRRK